MIGAGALPLDRRAALAVHAVAVRQVASVLAFAVAPLLLTVIGAHALVGNQFAFDFHREYWTAGQHVLHGMSPYDLRWQDIQHETAFPYNAVAALLFVPFALLPHALADAIFTVLCIGAVPLALRVLGVRDWRIYGLVFLWQPVVLGWATANVTLLLVLGVALMWRHRDSALAAGLLVALMVSVKLLVWPLAIWLLATRRYAAFGYALLGGLAMNVAAWFVLGFDQIGPYVKLLGLVTDHEESRSYTLLAFAVNQGAGRTAGYALALALAVAAGAACVALARRGDERHALLLCIAMALLATPVTWAHYFALLIVPLALLRPRLNPVWALPVVLALCPSTPTTWQLVLALATVTAIVALVLVRRAPHPLARAVPA
ncbi:MAG: alpha,2-mannosyltransferase [Solirubrobacteraceae bacterium]|nr:alpha,2-mannosyltransferase [Solirubrobacteraceae bacterium]